MIIIHSVKRLSRLLTPIVAARLRTAPVVVVVGARQTGKSTLVRELLPGPKRTYFTLDDLLGIDRRALLATPTKQ